MVDYIEYTNQFERLEINAADFSHTDHVGVAFEMLSRYDFLETATRYSKTINTLATRAGAAQKFNMTITLAFLSLIAERMELKPAEAADQFINDNPDLLSGNPIAKYYSKTRLSGDLARSLFLLPDLKAEN